MTIKNTEKNIVVPIIDRIVIRHNGSNELLTDTWDCENLLNNKRSCTIPAATGPNTVTKGINAFRNACLNAISKPFAPLAFAN